jgi:hypothetical protein
MKKNKRLGIWTTTPMMEDTRKKCGSRDLSPESHPGVVPGGLVPVPSAPTRRCPAGIRQQAPGWVPPRRFTRA